MKRILIAAALTATAALAQAQYVGPTTVPTTTVKALTEQGKDDQHAVLRGQITSSVGHEHYQFDDGTGQIRIKIDKKLWPAGKPVDASTKVELLGEYDKALFGDSKFKVKQIRIL